MKPVGLHRLDAHQAHHRGRSKKEEEIRKEEKEERKRIGSKREEKGGHPGCAVATAK